MSRWFQTYGFASVHGGLIVGALPLDEGDVQRLAALGVTRVLNLVEDAEYPRGARRKVERALADARIVELRLSTEDHGRLAPELLEEATARVNTWLDTGRVVYLHCRAGLQRSTAAAAGAIAIRDDITPEQALLKIQALKGSADPLPHQREDLQRWFETRARTGATRRPPTRRP